MAQTASNVYVAAPKATGAIWSAPFGTTLPATADAALDESFNCLGYISEDGITTQPEIDSEDIKAYGGDIVKTVQTSFKETYKFTPIETNQYTLMEQWGDDNVTVDATGKIKVTHNSAKKPLRSYIIETVLDDGVIQRDVIPQGRVSEIGEKKYVDGEAYAAEITISCEPDTNGNTTYTYIARTPVDMAKANIANIADQTYTGSSLTPEPVVSYAGTVLVKGTDYLVSYQDNTNVGVAKVIVTGIGAYTGTKNKEFNILAIDIAGATIANIPDQTYTGDPITPTLTVTIGSTPTTLVLNTDYTVEYLNNTEVGEAAAKITGTGHYRGTKTKTFNIVAATDEGE